jgi:general nucleoside transport system permease protein
LVLLQLEPRGLRSEFWTFFSPILAIFLTIVTMMAIFTAAGVAPLAAFTTFFISPLDTISGWTALIVRATPLIMIGLGLAFCYRANVWNIGGDGQFIIGAILGGGLALFHPTAPFVWFYPLVILTGVLGGAAYAMIVAWLKTQFNANEILTSLMLVYIAQLLLVWLVTGPWKDPEGFGFPQTAMFGQGATTPTFASTAIHLGCLLTPFITAAMWLVMSRTVLGFQLRVIGQAPRAARFAGFSEARLIWVALAVSGGLSGLAGIFEVTGPVGQLTASISNGYGFTAVIVAFLGRLHPVGVFFGGLLLALSFLGGDAAQIGLGMPNAITGIFQGVLLFYLLGVDVLILYRFKRLKPA